VLAALVDLASHGDRQAALLVTFSLLPRMVQAETHRNAVCRAGDDSYEQMAGLLWETIVTVPNPAVVALRESIERNVWRRKWRSERPIPTVQLDIERVGVATAGGGQVALVAAGRDVGEVVVEGLHVESTLARLESDGAVSAMTRRLLEHLAAGTEPPGVVGQSHGAARKQRWRTMSRLRETPAVLEALTA